MRLLGAIFQDPRELGLKQGTYRYDGKGDLKGHRFHLRVDSESKGVLMIDASKLIFLNGSALDYVRCYLEGWSSRDTAKYMRTRYRRLEKATLEEHYERVKSQFREYLKGDLALTYRCQNDCCHCYNETKDKTELTPEQWMTVIDKLWEIGVPHIVFTGGEPTLYEGLSKLVAQTEEHGQVTGMITNGRSLRTPAYLKELVKVGLDHVQITILSHKEAVHDRLVSSKGAWKETLEGLKVALSEDLYVSTNTTIMRSNTGDIEDTMRFLVGLGVRNIAFNSIIRAGKGGETEGITYEELTNLLVKLREIAEKNDINLIWYTPTPYHEFNPVNYGFGIKQCTACSMNMAIEPDGTVLPCQSYYKSLGNILTDPWPSIWNNELCKSIRERGYLDGDCVECDLRQVCGGGCPLSREHGDYVCLDRNSSM
jgi:radical SAM protein with 4Fe4S-binding SPASM domain